MKEKIKKFVGMDFNVAETLYLLKASNMPGYMSWGVSNIFTVGKPTKDEYGTWSDGLILKVNGRHFKGFVLITLNAGDLYDVHYVDSSNLDEVLESDTDLYFEDLFDTIDKKIEYVPEYGDR